MPAPVTYNNILRKTQIFGFELQFLYAQTQLAYDVSDWTFAYKMFDQAGNLIWDIQDGDITRENNSTISFSKSISDVQALTEDSYNAFLYVSNSEVTEQVWMKGVNTVEP